MSSTKSVVLFDCDGVLADMLGHWLSWISRTFGETCTREQITSWDVHEFFQCGTQVYQAFQNPAFWAVVPPIEGSQRAMKRLSKWITPVVVTSVPFSPAVRAQRIRWIRRMFPMIPAKNIVIASDKTCVQGDIIVDDGPQNLMHHPAHRLLVDMAYNRWFRDAERVHSWQEIEEHITAYLS